MTPPLQSQLAPPVCTGTCFGGRGPCPHPWCCHKRAGRGRLRSSPCPPETDSQSQRCDLCECVCVCVHALACTESVGECVKAWPCALQWGQLGCQWNKGNKKILLPLLIPIPRQDASVPSSSQSLAASPSEFPGVTGRPDPGLSRLDFPPFSL